MSSVAEKMMEHSGKDEFGNLVLLFEDKMIKMAVGEDGEMLLSCKDMCLACGMSRDVYNKTGFNGKSTIASFQYKYGPVDAKFTDLSSAIRSLARKKSPEAERFKRFILDDIEYSYYADPDLLPNNSRTEYRAIPGFTGYFAGEDGSIWKSDDSKWRQAGQVMDREGYFKVNAVNKYHGAPRPVHRLVLLAFRGEPEPGMVACHINGVKSDNRIENLRWGTSQDNADDCLRHGNRPRGDAWKDQYKR